MIGGRLLRRRIPVLAPIVVGLLALAIVVGPGRVPEESAPRSYQVALHLHGSSSEGTASMRLQTLRAVEHGYDALWWTDHDWRLARHTHFGELDFRQRKAIECIDVPDRGAVWSREGRCVEKGWRVVQREGPGRIVQDSPACEGLALEAGPSTEGASRRIALVGQSGRWKAFLGARPEIALEAEFEEEGASAILEIFLSEHPDLAGSGTARPVLTYRLGGEGAPGSVDADLRNARGTVRLRPERDLEEAGIPGGADHSIVQVEIAVEAAAGGRGSLCLQRLSLQASASPGERLEARREIARGLRETMGIPQFLGLEVSYGYHLLALFPGDHTLPDFSEHPSGPGGEEAVCWIESQGGLAVLAHPFGAGIDSKGRETRKEQHRRVALDQRLFGASILEVGYRQRVGDLAEHLALWDNLLSRGEQVVGIGTNDSHEGDRGWSGGNDFATWIWSADDSSGALLAGLREGRVYFGPARFDGEVELLVDGVPQMGGLVGSRGTDSIPVEARISGAPPGSELRWIVNGHLHSEQPMPGEAIADELVVSRQRTSFVRVEVWRGQEPVVFSNPVFLSDRRKRGRCGE